MRAHVATVILFAALAVCGLSIVSVPFLLDRRDGPANEQADKARFNHIFVQLAILIPIIAASAYVLEHVELSRSTGQAIAICVVALWILAGISPLWPGLRWKDGRLQRNPSARVANAAEENCNLSSVQDDSPLLPAKQRQGVTKQSHIGEDRNVWQVLRTANSWLITWGCFTTFGAYSILFLNLAQLCQAYGRPSASAFAVTLMMVSAASGRLGSCVFYSAALRRGMPGTVTFLVGNLLITISMLT